MSLLYVEGLDELNRQIDKLMKVSPEACKKEIADIALDLAGKSADAAPIKLGDLRGDLASPKKINDWCWEVGSSLPYTARQHENLEYNHPLGGGPKFIERPFNENKERYIREIKEAIQRELR